MQDDLNPQFLHARLERSETNLAIALPLGPVLYNSPVAAVLGLWPGSNDARSASNISPGYRDAISGLHFSIHGNNHAARTLSRMAFTAALCRAFC